MPATLSLLWLPWTALLSAVPAYFAYRAFRAGDRAAVCRRTGWALVPWALWLLGVLTLATRIADATVGWATRFAFNPLAWLGVGVAVAAVAMIAAGIRWGRRSADEVAPGRITGRPKGPSKATPDDDLTDIENILKKHGIS